ncbi:polysaccharide biosynthesis/export family protein [Chelatococcus reniformis]|uniref:polysaccharide biosynthesis/export family protein n=1 Tax=Chelatococcus reniformis TaxID=1494448 RepID=UPI00166320E6|nr:polysaccharide biosynthesis/export family protein [Chelatococcus reniformis]
MPKPLRVIAALAAFTIASVPLARAAESYTLGPQDKLRIKVYEWRASQDKLVEWEGLNDEFIVAANGTISLPLVGEVMATGKTPSEVASAIGQRLQRRMNLVQPPDTNVDVILYRPVYVVGDVTKPGDFPFRPGLTVLQAVSLAGGVLRTSDLARDALTTQGELASTALQRDGLIARQARLKSEAAGGDAVTFPQALLARRSAPQIAALLDQEVSIFKTRAEAYRTQTNALSALKSYLEKEVTSLVAQMETETTQAALINKELEGISSLVAKGLAAAPRQYALERAKAEMQGARLRLEASMLRAHQEISKADISLLELKNKREGDVAIEIRETDQKLQELRNRTRVTEGILNQMGPLVDGGPRRPEPSFTILRAGQPDAAPVAASDASAVQPGDTIKVILPTYDIRQTGEAVDSADTPAPGSTPVASAKSSASN